MWEQDLKITPEQSMDTNFLLITHPEHNSTEFQYSSKIQHMLEMEQKFLDIARHNQLQDDRLKLARRQVDKETNFPINSYVIILWLVSFPRNILGIKIIQITKNQHG